MIKKIIYSSIIIFFLFFFYFTLNSNEEKKGYLKILKDSIPLETRIALHKQYDLLTTKILSFTGHIPFNDYVNVIEFELNKTKISFKKFSPRFRASFITKSKHPGAIGNSYLEYFDNNLLVGTANGVFYYVDCLS